MKNESVIVALVFLVIVALFAFNFNKLTGFTAIQEKDDFAPEIKISPRIINAGEKMNIEININKGCVEPTFEIYSVRNGIVGTRKATKYYNPGIDDCATSSSRCSGSKYCTGNLKDDTIKVTFKTYAKWDGKYILRVFYVDENRDRKEIDSGEIEIIPSS